MEHCILCVFPTTVILLRVKQIALLNGQVPVPATKDISKGVQLNYPDVKKVYE